VSITKILFDLNNLLLAYFLGSTSNGIEDIYTTPFVLGNVFATGFHPMTVTATIRDKRFLFCQWKFGTNFENIIEFYLDFGYCDPFSDTDEVTVECLYEGGGLTITNITFTQPLVRGDLNIRIDCNHGHFGETLPTISIQGTSKYNCERSVAESVKAPFLWRPCDHDRVI